MQWLIVFFCFISAFHTFYAMELDLVGLNQLKHLPADLQKLALIQAKQTDEHIYDPSIDSFLIFKTNQKLQNQFSSFVPWRIETVQKNPQLMNRMEKENLNIIYTWNTVKNHAVPISSTDRASCVIAGPNKNRLAIVNDKAFLLSTEGKEEEESAMEFFYQNGVQPHIQPFCDYPTHIHPEKNCFIGEMHTGEKKLFSLDNSKKIWQEQELPPLKKPIIFGPDYLLVCKQLLKKPTLKHFNKELEIYDIYDTKTKTIYDTVDFSRLITENKLIPKDILKESVTSSYFTKKKFLPPEFLNAPEYEVDHLHVDYFPELKNFLLFSFNLNFCKEDCSYANPQYFYFVLYNIEKKLLHYVGNSKTQFVLSLPSIQKTIQQQSYQIVSDGYCGTVGFSTKHIRAENNLFIEKINPKNIEHQLFSLALIECTWKWLQEKNSSLKEGQEILKFFKNKDCIPNKLKLIWQTTTPEHGNIFKKIHEMVKKLEEKQTNA